MTYKRTYGFGSSHLSIEFGDITTSTAQILVSSDDFYLSMGGGVSASILEAGGQAIALDAAKKVPAALGDVIVTTAGSLPAQYIFHAVTIGRGKPDKTHGEIIRQTTSRCLQLVDALHLNSISFPTIGAGVAGFSYEDVAVEMAEVISRHLLDRQTPIDVTLYLFDRFGTMQNMDYIRFFEEFAKQVPVLASRAESDLAVPTVGTNQLLPNLEDTDEQNRMRRLNNLRKLIGSLEDKRFELEASLIDLINNGNEEEKAKLHSQLNENQELRLGLLNELHSLVQKTATGRPPDDTTETKRMEKVEMTLTNRYVDFDLHIAPNGHAIASSVEGQAISDISTEPPNDIQLALQLIERRQANLGLLKQVGQSLYDWLFPGPIHTHFQQTEAVVRRDKANLRLRLRIEASTIASLPLEFLYRAMGGYYLAVNPDTVLSRYLNLPLPSERVRRREGPLHMLAIIADPTDQTRLDPDEWKGIIEGALATPIADRQMTLETVKRATRKEIRNALLAQKPDIIQFVGHGIYQDGKGYLALVDENTGKTWLVDDERFANLYMGYDDNLGLISLATCESAQSDNPQGFLGIAPQLVQRGAPAVVAMQYEVDINAAKVFLDDFYTAVAARNPIDWAVQTARNAISLEFGLDNREFATPVLYMRAQDGVVF